MNKKKRGPQDATRRNIQAANKKIAALTRRVRTLERFRVAALLRLIALELGTRKR